MPTLRNSCLWHISGRRARHPYTDRSTNTGCGMSMQRFVEGQGWIKWRAETEALSAQKGKVANSSILGVCLEHDAGLLTSK